MKQEERLEYLLKELSKDAVPYISKTALIDDRRAPLRALMNIRLPKPTTSEFIKIQDEFLQVEAMQKGFVTVDDIPTLQEVYSADFIYADILSIWQGDITRLKVDAIVNAANSQLLGCFVPCHRCIDNAIHSAAGIQLRNECYEIMLKQGQEEPTGSAKITAAYNLPSKHVIHTVGPIVAATVSDAHRKALTSCYHSCLTIAAAHKVRSIAFCCISTGEFHFPNDEATAIAITTVLSYLDQNPDNFDRIIFNVYKDIDLELYQKQVRTQLLK